MENASKKEIRSRNISVLNDEELPDDFRDMVEKIKRHELFSPKYPQMLCNNARIDLRESLEKNPSMSLKEAILLSIKTLPEWMPPKFVLQVIETVVEMWEEHQTSRSAPATGA